MATKKREIYARVAVQLRTHDRAVRAESACPGAMGLYAWMLLQARGEETDGDVLEASALSSWGAPASYRRKQVDALIAVDLIERVEDARLRVVKYDEHNDGPSDIATNRAASTERTRLSRVRRSNASVTRDSVIGNTDVSCSISCSLSDLESRSEDPTGTRATPEPNPPPTQVRPLADVADPTAPPPPWWPDVLATVHSSVGVELASGECWLAYAGHRGSAHKRMPASRNDALQWLTQVMVPKARKALAEASRTRERDAKFDAERKAAAGVGPPPGGMSPRVRERETTEAERAETQRLMRLSGGLFAVPNNDAKRGTGTE